ncbi:c-type cytochrome [Sulfitobacter sp. SK012]|uniref:c-type cytochrome n=1 Tax=Sulfitobacter sp. SK012 TaxID=1389005 RepID=UPI0013B41CC0|nr:cytochrome c [Sulfitobacter sp. SK012]
MNKLLRTAAAIGVGLAIVSTTAVADGHDKAAAAAVGARSAQMGLVAYHTGILGGMAGGKVPYDAEVAKAAATNLHAAASLARVTMWVAGTEQGAVPGSRAKAEIWSDAAGFEEKFAMLEKASADMIDAAGTDLDSLKAGMGAVGGTCKACHEAYRGPRN